MARRSTGPDYSSSPNPNGFDIVDTTAGTREPDSITAATYAGLANADPLPDQVSRNITVTGPVILYSAAPSVSAANVWSPFGSGTGLELSYCSTRC